MDIVLRSEELKKYFKNNGVLTDSIANQIFNKIEIDLTSSTSITRDLNADILAIAREHPSLLRHIVIKNSGQNAIDMQPLINTLGTTGAKVFDIRIENKHKESFKLDLSKFKNLKEISLINTDPSGLVQASDVLIDPTTKGIRLSGFDLSTLDLVGKNIKTLNLDGSRNVNFAKIRGIENLTKIGVTSRSFDQEVLNIIDFVNKSKNINNFSLRYVDLKDIKLLRVLSNPNLTSIGIANCNLKDLDGLEKWQDKLSFLGLYGNNIALSDLSRINEFRRKNPRTTINILSNPNIESHLSSLSDEEFSNKTYTNIYDAHTIELEKSGKKITKSNALRYLLDNERIPCSINDAERLRKAGIVLNPIELEDDSQLDTFDFEQDYLKGGLLLLTVNQIEQLIKSGKKIPMDIGIEIKDASELSAEKLEEIYSKIKIKEVRMVGPDLSNNQRAPYTPIEYYRARQLLDEVVSGIDTKESDLDKFTTIYMRLANSMAYDQRAIKNGTTDEIRHSRDVVDSCRNLVGGLATGECVCAGYAETLRNALALVGIKARYIRGKTFLDPDYGGRHAWTHVELADENGEKKWYYADLTWDEQVSKKESDKGQYRYVLLNEEQFKAKHQVCYTRNMKTTSKKSYDRLRLAASMKKAQARMLNPRKSLKERIERQKAQKEENLRKEEEKRKEIEKKREEEAKKKQEEEKKKQEEQKKSEEAKKKQEEDKKKQEEQKKSEEKIDYTNVTIDELENLISKKNDYKQKLDEIDKLLDSAKGLSPEKIKEYEEKRRQLEDEYSKKFDQIVKYKKALYEKEKIELDKKKQELEDLKEQDRKAKNAPKTKKIVVVEMTKEEKIADLEEKIANREAVLVAYGDRAHDNRYEELAKWKKELEELRTKDDDENEISKKEVENLKSKIANREAMIAGRGDELNPERFKELEAWKKKLEEIENSEVTSKQEPIDPNIENKIKVLEAEIKEREERINYIQKEEILYVRVPKLMSSAAEVKEVVFTSPTKPDPKISSEEHITYGNSKYLQINSREDLVKVKKESRADLVEKSILGFTNKILRRDDKIVPDAVRSIIEAGVSIYTNISDTIYKVTHKGKDRYAEELDALLDTSKTVIATNSPLDSYKVDKSKIKPTDILSTKEVESKKIEDDERV